MDSNTLVLAIKDCLLCLNLSVSKAHGQCYDTASNMSVAKNGVAKQIQDEEKRAVYKCIVMGMLLTWLVQMPIKGCKITKDV